MYSESIALVTNRQPPCTSIQKAYDNMYIPSADQKRDPKTKGWKNAKYLDSNDFG